MSGGCGRWRECEGDMMREHERVREYESKIVYGNIYIYIYTVHVMHMIYIYWSMIVAQSHVRAFIHSFCARIALRLMYIWLTVYKRSTQTMQPNSHLIAYLPYRESIPQYHKQGLGFFVILLR